MKQDKLLLLVRGLPGAGKTTLAETLAALNKSRSVICAADEHFEQKDGSYKFVGSELPLAHTKCRQKAVTAMRGACPLVIVTNTFTTDAELDPYFTLASTFGYRVSSIIVENRANTHNIHGVPKQAMTKMENRFSVRLRPPSKPTAHEIAEQGRADHGVY